jgi:hypothetical protein
MGNAIRTPKVGSVHMPESMIMEYCNEDLTKLSEACAYWQTGDSARSQKFSAKGESRLELVSPSQLCGFIELCCALVCIASDICKNDSIISFIR